MVRICRMRGSSGKIDASDGYWQARTAARVPEGRQHRHVACRKLQIWSSPRRASPLVSAGARSGGGCSFRDQADLFGNVGSAGSELRRLDGAWDGSKAPEWRALQGPSRNGFLHPISGLCRRRDCGPRRGQVALRVLETKSTQRWRAHYWALQFDAMPGLMIRASRCHNHTPPLQCSIFGLPRNSRVPSA